MIIATDSPVRNLAKYIQCADLSNERDLRALSAIAERTDAMTETEANILSGALDAESVSGLDDVLRIAQSLEQYEIIPVTIHTLHPFHRRTETARLHCRPAGVPAPAW